MKPSVTRADSLALDAADPLRRFLDLFVVADPSLIYLDGNSLGRLPAATAAAMVETIDRQWGDGLVRSWHDWIDLPTRTGDQIAPLVGAHPGEVLVADQTSVNLYKLAAAALAFVGRPDIVTDEANFPSDRYVLDAVARAAGGRLRIAGTHPIDGVTTEDVSRHLDERVGLVSLSHVGFKSGAVSPMAEISALTDSAGALTLWDLSHSAGAVPIRLDRDQASLAVGCTYKYLNAGPGAPGFLYVRGDLHQHLTSPIPGWFGHDDMFAFEPDYRPAPGIRRFAAGTPPIISLRGVEHGVALTAEAGMEAIRTKSVALTEHLIACFDARLEPLGCTLGTPRHAARRGSHVAVRHPDGYRLTQALIARGVVVDFRAADTIRLGVAPLYTTFTEVFDAVEHLAEILETGEHETYPGRPGRVT
jgi:kynureninase